jgi:hypothetical protein
MGKDLNYKKIDMQYKYSYREDRLNRARELGYTYISECTAKLYQKHQSTSKVAEILGLSTCGVATELKRIGVTLRPQGGNNYKGKKRIGRHSWNPLSTNTRSQMSRPQ